MDQGVAMVARGMLPVGASIHGGLGEANRGGPGGANRLRGSISGGLRDLGGAELDDRTGEARATLGGGVTAKGITAKGGTIIGVKGARAKATVGTTPVVMVVGRTIGAKVARRREGVAAEAARAVTGSQVGDRGLLCRLGGGLA